VTEQSLFSQLATKALPLVAGRAFPPAWTQAGDDRARLGSIAKKRRAMDGPRPDLVLERRWRRGSTQVHGRELSVLTPKTGSTGTILFYCHGGAFVFGPSAIEWLFATKLATALNTDLALYDYPKVPEYDSTATLPATLAAYDQVAERYEPSGIAFAGSSAGGGLAISTMLQLQRAGRIMPPAALLISPWLDLTLSHPDIAALQSSDRLLPVSGLRRDGELYAGPNDARDPLVSPLFANADALASLPPTVVVAGEREILLPEARDFVDNLTAAGVRASLHTESFGQHAGVILASREGKAALKQATDEMRQVMSAQ